MAADIVKRSDSALLISRDDHARIGDISHEVITRIRKLASPPRAEPHITMNSFHLALEPFRISVVALWQRERFRDRQSRTSVGVGRRHYLNIATFARIAKIAAIEPMARLTAQVFHDLSCRIESRAAG